MQGSELEPDGLNGGGGQLFGMELEGMSPEDQEYEVAQRLVRFGPGGRGQPRPPRRHARHGRWIRRGRTIVIVNCNSPGPSAPS